MGLKAFSFTLRSAVRLRYEILLTFKGDNVQVKTMLNIKAQVGFTGAKF
jgi:hypothetical protein